MNTVRQILRVKGKQVWKVSKDATVLEALKVMAEKGVSAVVVMNGNQIAGIFTERDFARKVGLYEIKPSEIKVGDVMTGDLITITQDETVSDCMRIMTEKRIRHLPVVEDGQLVGIISIGDVVKDLIDELQFMVEQLENYIRGLR